MKLTLMPASLSGTVAAIPSKSWAHRLLLCAALSREPTVLVCPGSSRDIRATVRCLTAMGAQIKTGSGRLSILPGPWKPGRRLPCGESGSTLRFLLPVAAALGLEVELELAGRLPVRPLEPLIRELEAHGAALSRPSPQLLRCRGRLRPGDYRLPGNVSSQFISGLLFALPLLDGPSTLTVAGPVESGPYVTMTLSALAQFGIPIVRRERHFEISPAPYRSPGRAAVEGDWSNAAFWLCAGALGGPVAVTGLNRDSLQGDRAIDSLLTGLGASVRWNRDCLTVRPGPLIPRSIDAAAIPDLVPVLAVLAAAIPGQTRITNAGRLRLKESDRLESVCRLLTGLGGAVRQTEDTLTVCGGRLLTGGQADSCGDHRIAMAAAVAACLCTGPVELTGAEAVEKSYPDFWRDYRSLGGIAEEAP